MRETGDSLMDTKKSSFVMRVPGPVGPPPEQPVMPDYSNAPRCAHPESEIRRDNHPTVGIRFRRQCLTCGHGMGLVGKEKVGSFLGMKDFDYRLADDWRARVEAFYKERREAHERAVTGFSTARSDWYAAYLLSPKWKAIRDKVLVRDGHRCQGCLGARATQVHHLTYDHVGDELLFELIAVCDFCHERVHGKR